MSVNLALICIYKGIHVNRAPVKNAIYIYVSFISFLIQASQMHLLYFNVFL